MFELVLLGRLIAVEPVDDAVTLFVDLLTVFRRDLVLKRKAYCIYVVLPSARLL